MFSDVHKHVLKKFAETKVELSPYPHLVIDNIFPDDFYELLLKNNIDKSEMINLRESNRVGPGYSGARYVLNLDDDLPMLTKNRMFWQNVYKYLNFYFKDMLLHKFNQNRQNIYSDALYTKDYQTYSLNPHTDFPAKLLTCLIYLPVDNSMSDYGTSIYIPKDKNFKCLGGPQHKVKNFDLHKTISFTPNKMFCFLKTDNSFHGVEPIDKDVERTLLIFDLRKTK
jgi:hypothetical protein